MKPEAVYSNKLLVFCVFVFVKAKFISIRNKGVLELSYQSCNKVMASDMWLFRPFLRCL